MVDPTVIDLKFWGAMILAGGTLFGWIRSSFTLGRRIGSFEERIVVMDGKINSHSEEFLILKATTCVGGDDCEKIRITCRNDMLRELASGDGRMGRIENAIRDVDQAAQRRHDALVAILVEDRRGSSNSHHS